VYSGDMFKPNLQEHVLTMIAMRKSAVDIQKNLDVTIDLIMGGSYEFRSRQTTKDAVNDMMDIMEEVYAEVHRVAEKTREALRISLNVNSHTRSLLTQFIVDPMSDAPELSDSALRALVGLRNE